MLWASKTDLTDEDLVDASFNQTHFFEDSRWKSIQSVKFCMHMCIFLQILFFSFLKMHFLVFSRSRLLPAVFWASVILTAPLGFDSFIGLLSRLQSKLLLTRKSAVLWLYPRDWKYQLVLFLSLDCTWSGKMARKERNSKQNVIRGTTDRSAKFKG